MYQKTVVEANIESWYAPLAGRIHKGRPLTFPSALVPLTPEELRLFVRLFESRAKRDADMRTVWETVDGAAETFDDLVRAWSLDGAAEDRAALQRVHDRLRAAIDEMRREFGCSAVFVKCSSRSPKDAVVAQNRLQQRYRELLLQARERLAPGTPLTDNERLRAALDAGVECMRVTCASHALQLLLSSERICQDITLALDRQEKMTAPLSIVVRPWVDIDSDMEFRAFAFGPECRLNAISQYNHLLHSARLHTHGPAILASLLSFYEDAGVRDALRPIYAGTGCVVDFAIERGDPARFPEGRVWVIEVNPFLESTDAALFSWRDERALLQGEGRRLEDGPTFRLTPRPIPSLRAMLTIDWRQLIDAKNDP